MLNPYRRGGLAVAVLALAGLQGVTAQITSNATCLSEFQGLYNSKGQSPCLVAAYLGGACNGGQYDISALLPDQHYIGPTAALTNACQCSTVMYSMMGGCSACQNATVISWSSWSAACTNVYVDIFLNNIPASTSVPGWAYENVTQADTFNVQNALADSSPESTATNSQTTRTGTAGGAQSTSLGATNTSGSSSKSSSNTGAIAGGVVGGVVALALIGLVAFLLVRRSNNRRRATAAGAGSAYGGDAGTGGMVAGTAGTPFMGQHDYAPMPGTPFGGPTSPPLSQPKLYDPNDPSTFPSSPAPPTLNSQYSGPVSHNSGYTQPGAAGVGAHNQGMYRGVAEV